MGEAFLKSVIIVYTKAEHCLWFQANQENF